MRDKVIMFIIGVLVGAVISTGAFFIYTKVSTCNTNNNQNTQMPGGTPPSMPNGQGSQQSERPNDNNGQPPEKPNDSNTQNDNTQDNN